MAAVLVVGSQLGSWHLNEGEVWGEQGGRGGVFVNANLLPKIPKT